MKMNKTIWTVTQAYQDATDGEESEIHAYTEVCKTRTSALNRVREWITQQVESHYEGNDDWTENDTIKLVDEIFALGNSLCSSLHFKWVNDWEHVAWAVQGHNI